MTNHPSALLLGIVLVFSNACHESTQTFPDANADRLVQTPPGSKERLSLGEAELIPGTTVFRANLSVNREEGFSSKGSYFETRNILFIDPSDKAAHWLLPDTKHVIESATDIGESRAGIGDPAGPASLASNINTRSKKTLAILTYAKVNREHWRDFTGELLLSDSTGRQISEIADEVKNVQAAMLLGNEIVIIYERNHRLVLQAFNPTSLAKKREQEIEIPALK
jgi:hypothetical protein